MKNRKIIYIALSIILVLVVISVFTYKKSSENLKLRKLPEPSQAVIAEVNEEFEGLSLEETIKNIQAEKSKLDFFLALTSNRDETYKDRESIPEDKVRTTSGFSILSANEYEEKYNQYINSLSFNQEIVYPNSIISIFFDGNNDITLEHLPKLTITKIAYKNGSYDDTPIKYKDPIELETSKLIDFIEVNAEYSYISDFKVYKINKETPIIKTDKFEIKLNELSENYASFSSFGDIIISDYNVLNSQNKALSYERKSYYSVGYQEIINDYVLDIYNLSKYKYTDKSELIYQLARYRQNLNNNLDRDFEIKYEGLYKGNTNSINIYSPTKFEKNKTLVKINSTLQDEKVKVIDEKNETWGLIGNDGEFIIKGLDPAIKEISNNYFYKKKIDKTSNRDEEKYELLKFDIKSNSLVKKTDTNYIHIVDVDHFILEKNNNFYLHYDNTKEKPPILLEPKSNNINNIDFYHYEDRNKYTGFFYIKDNDQYYIYNNDGKLLIPPQKYDIDYFDDGVLQIKPDFFKLRESKVEDKYFYYIFIDGSPTLTINNYDDANKASNGLIRVNKDNKYGFVDLSGNIVIPIEYDKAYDFSEGYSYVEKNNLAGLIDKKGNVVIPLKYENLSGNSMTNGIRYYYFNNKSYNAKELIEVINAEN